jgi:hypothetical protein
MACQRRAIDVERLPDHAARDIPGLKCTLDHATSLHKYIDIE